MRNKNAQNNGKDGEYGEGKNEKEKRRENYPCNLVETALAACDVSTICNLADYLQVHSTVGMDHGISGGKTCDICTSDLGENLGWISKFYITNLSKEDNEKLAAGMMVIVKAKL